MGEWACRRASGQAGTLAGGLWRTAAGLRYGAAPLLGVDREQKCGGGGRWCNGGVWTPLPFSYCPHPAPSASPCQRGLGVCKDGRPGGRLGGRPGWLMIVAAARRRAGGGGGGWAVSVSMAARRLAAARGGARGHATGIPPGRPWRCRDRRGRGPQDDGGRGAVLFRPRGAGRSPVWRRLPGRGKAGGGRDGGREGGGCVYKSAPAVAVPACLCSQGGLRP